MSVVQRPPIPLSSLENAQGPEPHVPPPEAKMISSGQGGYHVIRTLGEGAYGEVMLVTDAKGLNLIAAMKQMNFKTSPNAKKEGKKEALIMQMLSDHAHHPNIIQYIGIKTDAECIRLFIEYADGGELFDQIEPEKGVGSPAKAQYYFRQLMDGIAFIHKYGVCHRDIKPENLFLTKSDSLKIGDFGLATIFRHENKERMLSMSCGTKPYASPEVLKGRYRGEACDVWSCGIVLVAMLAGELPWQAPDVYEDDQFASWASKREGWEERKPWNRIGHDAMFLLRSMLNVEEKARCSVAKVMQHPWYTANLAGPPPKRRRILMEAFSSPPPGPAVYQPISQPITNESRVLAAPTVPKGEAKRTEAARAAFSQPCRPDSLLLTQSQITPTQSQRLNGMDALARLARRMTRFCVTTDIHCTISKIIPVCTKHGVLTQMKAFNEVMGRIGELAFNATVYEMVGMNDGETKHMVDFRRSRGDGLAFKRLFRLMRVDLEPIICLEGTSWLESQGLLRSQLS